MPRGVRRRSISASIRCPRLNHYVILGRESREIDLDYGYGASHWFGICPEISACFAEGGSPPPSARPVLPVTASGHGSSTLHGIVDESRELIIP